MRREWKRDRIFKMALGVSFILHFSMVTVFRIVIYFPYDSVDYYRVSIVEANAVSAFSQAFHPDEDDVYNLTRYDSHTVDRFSQEDWLNLPSVDLPRLNFSALNEPSSHRLDTQTRLRYAEHFDTQPDDLWAQVGEKLSMVGYFFTRDLDSEAVSSEEKYVPIAAGQPAPGFMATVEWMTPPYTRQPLLVEKVEALWGESASVLAGLKGESVVLVFRVNREGDVTFVQLPLLDEAGVVRSSADALKKYRFTPLLEGPEEQHGTLTIRAKAGEGMR